MKKGALATALAALLLAILTLSAMSAARTQAAQLWYNDIRVTLDGEEIVPKDAGGNTVSPFIIDGTTYLPVRAVAQAVDLDVGWDENSNTVKLSGTPEQVEAPVYSRDNPAPLGVPQTVMISFDNKKGYVAEVKVTEVTHGKEAYQLIKEKHEEVEKPDAGMEYLIARVSITLLQNNAEYEHDSYRGTTKYTFVIPPKAYSSDGNEYDRATVEYTRPATKLVNGIVCTVPNTEVIAHANIQLEPKLETIFGSGQEQTEGYIVFSVSEDDPAPMLVYGQDPDGTGAAWFSLAEA